LTSQNTFNILNTIKLVTRPFTVIDITVIASVFPKPVSAIWPCSMNAPVIAAIQVAGAINYSK
jgi:hypothetical protein